MKTTSALLALSTLALSGAALAQDIPGRVTLSNPGQTVIVNDKNNLKQELTEGSWSARLSNKGHSMVLKKLDGSTKIEMKVKKFSGGQNLRDFTLTGGESDQSFDITGVTNDVVTGTVQRGTYYEACGIYDYPTYSDCSVYGCRGERLVNRYDNVVARQFTMNFVDTATRAPMATYQGTVDSWTSFGGYNAVGPCYFVSYDRFPHGYYPRDRYYPRPYRPGPYRPGPGHVPGRPNPPAHERPAPHQPARPSEPARPSRPSEPARPSRPSEPARPSRPTETRPSRPSEPARGNDRGRTNPPARPHGN